jgi:hypothetical protein
MTPIERKSIGQQSGTQVCPIIDRRLKVNLNRAGHPIKRFTNRAPSGHRAPGLEMVDLPASAPKTAIFASEEDTQMDPNRNQSRSTTP